MGFWFWMPILLRALAAIIEIMSKRAKTRGIVSGEEEHSLQSVFKKVSVLRSCCVEAGMRVPSEEPPAA